MAYSITLQFRISGAILNALKEISIPGEREFDWRETTFCHCTVKAIALPEVFPPNDTLTLWANTIECILRLQEAFTVRIEGTGKFPKNIHANVYSQELILLHQRLFPALPSSFPEWENENYIPHVSLVRLRSDIDMFLPSDTLFGTLSVDTLEMMIWNLDDLTHPHVFRTFRLQEDMYSKLTGYL